MKKSIYTSITLLATASLLMACSHKESTTIKETNTIKTSQISKENTTANSTMAENKSQTTTDRSSTEPEKTGMDIQAIKNGDYSSITGTWQNEEGDSLVFDKSGILSTGLIVTGSPKEDQGILQGSVYHQSGGGGFILLFVPKGVAIPQSHFYEGKDTTDTSRDRLIGTQIALSSATIGNSTFYKVSDSTEVVEKEQPISLTQGQSTIDYANSVLGDRSWTIIDDNYNRTELNPFSTIQGNDNSIYLVYQNGLITTENGTVEHQP
ncbi:DUF6287 domain-containing protein [Streptococcus gallolyticus]|uniref:DUF6287 domain-containing protein n=1 Tax=Streptococcus hepaticus TaxID=3349163 RepID=UPI001C9457CC|nr:DUF6287 domain-containing protein [Streptococcus gallolyticus]MBY5041346.1 DUF6287 domain-containing protein [Streptococcus gallolyticus]